MSLFSKEFVYGRILHQLYLNADKPYKVEGIFKAFEDEDELYILTQLKLLEKDNLIRVESAFKKANGEIGGSNTPRENLYRISIEGYNWIYNLKKDGQSDTA